MLVTVGRYFDPWEAHILRARLEAEGIPASVAGDQHVIANWPLSVALGGAALQVPDAYAEQASQIVADYHGGSLQDDLVAEHPEAEIRCPACDSTAIDASIPVGSRLLNIATFLLASAPFPTHASDLQCQACSHRWRNGD